jgi:hypothetical protein
MPVQEHIRRSERPKRRRYQPTAAYALAERVKEQGVEISAAEGPWRPGGRPLPRPGRNHLDMIPLVTNGRTEVMVDSIEHAADLSGFLTWCGLADLNPVSDLDLPPPESFAGPH